VKRITQTLFAMLMLGLGTLATSGSKAQEAVPTIEIHAHRFSFVPSEITLTTGKPVKLVLISDDVTHSLLVEGLKINKEASKGHPAEITITPNSAGDFRGECGRFCGSGHGSMLFMIHVKD
jgi:cytochrome c oxidase subunit II